jgi:hypothetical protein
MGQTAYPAATAGTSTWDKIEHRMFCHITTNSSVSPW